MPLASSDLNYVLLSIMVQPLNRNNCELIRNKRANTAGKPFDGPGACPGLPLQVRHLQGPGVESASHWRRNGLTRPLRPSSGEGGVPCAICPHRHARGRPSLPGQDHGNGRLTSNGRRRERLRSAVRVNRDETALDAVLPARVAEALVGLVAVCCEPFARDRSGKPGSFPERIVDPCLPAGSVGAESSKDVRIEAKRGADFRHL